jgi:hypothetical protein
MKKPLAVNELGHWQFKGKLDHSDYFGFLYAIEKKLVSGISVKRTFLSVARNHQNSMVKNIVGEHTLDRQQH